MVTIDKTATLEQKLMGLLRIWSTNFTIAPLWNLGRRSVIPAWKLVSWTLNKDIDDSEDPAADQRIWQFSTSTHE